MTHNIPTDLPALRSLRDVVDLAIREKEQQLSAARDVIAKLLAEGHTMQDLAPAAPVKAPAMATKSKRPATRKSKSNGHPSKIDPVSGVIYSGRGRAPRGYDKSRAVPM